MYFSSDKTKVIIISPIAEMNESIDFINRMQYRYDNLLIIGNGFDLNLGLQTTYRDFTNSWIFKRMYVKRMQEKQNTGNPQPSLIDFLYGKKYIEKWYDIEASLLEYVSRKPDGSFVNNIKEDKKDYYLVCKSLIEYLASLFKEGAIDSNLEKKMMESPGGRLLWSFMPEAENVYSFNYTPIEWIMGVISGRFRNYDLVKVHGEIKKDTIIKGNIYDNTIILGIETNDMSNIAPGYSFMLKSNNKNFKSINIASDLMNTRNVIIFGHSLNQMDFGYFDSYFRMLAINTDQWRKLTIITKNDSSRIAILDNLRKMGISVRDIFAHTKVEIILTDNLVNKKSEDSRLFEELLLKVSY